MGHLYAQQEKSVIDTITSQQVADDQRINITADLFGVCFPLRLEPFVYAMTSKLSDDYSGGYWQFYTLSNGGFYMASDSDGRFQVISENGHECMMSADALGITVCLYAYSHLSFGDDEFSEICVATFYFGYTVAQERTGIRVALVGLDEHSDEFFRIVDAIDALFENKFEED